MIRAPLQLAFVIVDEQNLHSTSCSRLFLLGRQTTALVTTLVPVHTTLNTLIRELQGRRAEALIDDTCARRKSTIYERHSLVTGDKTSLVAGNAPPIWTCLAF